MSNNRLPPEALRAGRRCIEALQWAELLQDLTWVDAARAWGMCCRVTIDAKDSTNVPSQTDWWVTMGDDYPFGKIVFRPATENGLKVTFPHQQYNGRAFDQVGWRSGDICIRAPSFVFGKYALDPDPIGHVNRLAWHFQRARLWLEAAATDTLVNDGDPFELPDFPTERSERYTVAHGETADSFKQWMDECHCYGTAEMVAVDPPANKTIVVRRFFDRQKNELVVYPWGSAVARSERLVVPAVWLRCGRLPIIPPYQAIARWDELFAYLRQDGREADFQRVLDLVRDGYAHLLLLGFPIPTTFHRAASRMHWQPVRLPVLSHRTSYRKGFRANSRGYWLQDKYEHFASGKKIEWQKAENWSVENVASKGRIDCMSSVRSAVVGVGAVGSVVAELLVRANCGPLVVCDEDDVEHGNLCRHTLGIGDAGRNKAEAVADRLRKSQIHADVQSVSDAFPPDGESDRDTITKCDVIIDCTGEDSTLHAFAQYPWSESKLFCSVSLSFEARRMYVYTARGGAFPVEDFQVKFAEWAKRDAAEFSGRKLVQAETGCWHPSFPARIDQVWMLSAAAVRRLEEAVGASECTPRLVVYEQVCDECGFQGVRKHESS